MRLISFRLRRYVPVATLLLSASVSVAQAQNFFERWEARASATQAQQPKWIVPLIAPYPTLIQVLRADFLRQVSPTGVENWNLDASRGVNLIPYKRTEVDINLPPFIEHGDKTPNGFGDFSFTGKYRIASGNAQHGNYAVMSSLTVSVPTGSYANGTSSTVYTPYVVVGKGWKKFDVVSGIGSGLPQKKVNTIGRTVTTNSYAQYQVGKYLWPEVEVNTTAWYGGSKDGKVQTFVSPGIVFGKFPAHPDNPKARSGPVFGVGFQTAATHYHVYNHALVFSARWIF